MPTNPELNPEIQKKAAYFIGLIHPDMREEMDYAFDDYGYNLNEEIRDNSVCVFFAMTQRSFQQDGQQIRWFRKVIKELGYEGEFEPLRSGGGWNAGEYGTMLRTIKENDWKILFNRFGQEWIFTTPRRLDFLFINWLNTDPLEDKS